jgi:glycosyltransferase involved in cell wall biosynthesis
MLCTGHAVTDERVTHKQAKSLARAGHQVLVIGRGELRDCCVRDGLELRAVSPVIVGLRRRARLILPMARLALEWRPDIVTCHEPESVLGGLWVRRRCGARVVFDCHELWHETFSSRQGRLRPLVRCVSVGLMNYLGRRVDWVSVVSPASRDFFVNLRHDGRVDIIHNSPMPEWFPASQQDGLSGVLVCHDGVFSTDRGMVPLLKAVALARQQVPVGLLVVGRVPPCDQELYSRTVAELNLGPAIIGPEWVRYDRLGEALARGQIGVVAMQPTPNNFLSLSNKVYNYMACAQPVIAPIGSATQKLVEDAQCGLSADSTDPNSIAAAIVTLAKDAELRKRLGANGRRAIVEQYGWHIMERRLGEIYGGLSGPCAAPA